MSHQLNDADHDDCACDDDDEVGSVFLARDDDTKRKEFSSPYCYLYSREDSTCAGEKFKIDITSSYKDLCILILHVSNASLLSMF